MMDGYIRVSRASAARQASDGYHSPEIQRAAILRWAQQNDVEVGVIEKDENVSGGKRVKDRKLDGLIKRVEEGVSDGVIVYNVKRFGRSMAESCVAVARVREVNGRIVSVEDGADTDRSMLHFDIMTALGAEELRGRTQGWSDAATAAVADGKHIASKAAIGYLRKDQVDPQYDDRNHLIKNARLVVDPDNRARARRAFEMRAAGASHLQIAKETGLPRSTVTAILRNRVYLGEARGPGGVVNPTAHEPIVDETLFAAVQARQGERATPRRDDWKVQPLLSGLITCAHCGSKLQITRRSYKGERLPSYVCMSKWQNTKPCDGASADVRKVDDYVVSQLDLDDDRIGALFHGAEQAWTAARENVRVAEEELEQFVEIAFGLRKELFARGLEVRQEAVNVAKRQLYELEDPGLDTATFRELNLGPEYGVVRFQARGDDPARDRLRMRRVLAEVTLERADPKRRMWQPISERVKIRWKGEPEVT